jgi:hypothetical protein
MPDYQQGKIYTIRCRTDKTLIYVGSTIQPLYKRLWQHKYICIKDKYKHLLIYKTINNEWNNWYIELYELYPCSCKDELHKKEGEIIREIGTLNMNISGRKLKEYYIDNKNDILNKSKEWRENNLERKKENSKKHYENHKEIYLEKAKKYRNNNSENITCECGCIIKIYNLSNHKKTKKHLELTKTIRI